ncbi:HDIG domain-containing protein [bacterium]|nr:HDIG domain-containing protein [bacterium]
MSSNEKSSYKAGYFSNLIILIVMSFISAFIVQLNLKNVVILDYKLGDISEINVRAPENIQFVQKNDKFINELNHIMDNITEYISFGAEVKKENLGNLTIILKNQLEQGRMIIFSDKEIRNLLSMSKKDVQDWKKGIIKVSEKYLSGVAEAEIPKIQYKLIMGLAKNRPLSKESPFFAKVAGYLARHLPLRRTILKGKMIIRKGELIKGYQLHQLKKMNIQLNKKKPQWVEYLGIFIITFILFSLMALYLYKYRIEVIESNRLFILTFLVFVIFLVFAKVSYFLIFVKDISIEISGSNLRLFSPYFIPTACFAMIFAILFDFNFSLLLSIILSFFVGLIFRETALVYSMYAFIGAVTGGILVTNFRERWQIIRAGIAVSIVNFILIITFYLLQIEPYESNAVLFLNFFWGSLSGILSSVIAIGGLPFFENLFCITTSIKLLELIEFNQPLLQQLILDAPGTYHHSVIVSNLSEAAAREVGADPLLCKVGAYYHDIGKMKRSYFFVENQNGENAHDELSPNLSSLIIISHVKDGVDLAKEHKLPESIIDIIRQHHGTSLVAYFYNRAKNNEKQSETLEQKFRYQGPKPQSKEAAIIMLADSIESAARTLNKPNPVQITNLISRIVNQKFDDGQMDSCEITMKNIETLERVFAKILISMYHSRIEYPQEITRISQETDINNA